MAFNPQDQNPLGQAPINIEEQNNLNEFTNASDLENSEKDAQRYVYEQLNITSDYDCYASFPVNRVNIPEPRNLNAGFVYNYYTTDERSSPESSNINNRVLNLQTDSTSDILYQAANDRLARYVTLSFEPPSTYGFIKKTTASDIIEENIDKIYMEGTSTNTFFTGVDFNDTGAEKKIFDMVSGSIFFQNIQVESGSPQDAANKLYDTMSEKGGLQGDDKRLLKKALGNMQANGYVLARSDIPEDVRQRLLSPNPLAGQTFAIQFNNLVFADMISHSTKISDTIYQDEIRGLLPFSLNIQNQSISDVSNSSINEDDYEFTLDAVETFEVPAATVKSDAVALSDDLRRSASKETPSISNKTTLGNKYPKIKFAGYIIQKYEVNKDETLKFIGYLYAKNINNLYLVDQNVRYGGTYIYKVRSVCIVDLVAKRIPKDAQNAELSSLCIARILLASKGATTSVECFEKLPPPPPENLRVGFNFKRKLPFLSWQFPLNPQRDIKRFQIFKRSNLESPYTLIAEYDFDNSDVRGNVSEIALEENLHRLNGPRVNFLDIDYKVGDKPIYALASVDAHGMSSNYSAQIQVEYNRMRNKIDTTLISGPGAPKPYPNLLLEFDGFEDAIKVSGYKRMKIFFDPEYYKVLRNEQSSNGNTTEASLNFLRVNKNVDTYKLHMVNLDLQKDEIVNIRIEDISGSPFSSSPATFSNDTHSFT